MSFHYTTKKKTLFVAFRLYPHTFLCTFSTFSGKKASAKAKKALKQNKIVPFLHIYPFYLHFRHAAAPLPFHLTARIHKFQLEIAPILRYNEHIQGKHEFYTENDYLYDYEKK